ncbi:MAG: hypothetical protein KGZ80_00435 [Methylomonas sp.]|nr:hypothetical protein [Methylomonas sp.]PPD22373.1 MAG: hypothetical protein CTY23_02120 [Methylomonas sp.]PPD26877.1 MAG: hypothetical protein CTY22_03855 [Methylomonas sp.]PPD37668.1 MAG: hypothetical protein CTY17_10655 [Methylomonas sp.]PPD38785.1 MAG: hypothetical protein CTY21_03855 [Methylomonas sp.]
MRLAKAVVCQLLAFGLTRLVAGHLFAILPHPVVPFVAQGVIAACLARLWGQERWWQGLHLLLPISAWLLLTLSIPPWLYLLGFLALVLVFWGTAWGDVPLFLSSNAVIEALVPIIEQERPARLAELGAGIGSVVIPLARRFPDLKIHAIEKAPLPWLVLRWRCRSFDNVEVLRQDFWQHSLKPYSVVYAFLSPLVMVRLGEQAARDMRCGGLLLSAAFDIPGWTPETRLALMGGAQKDLFCYRLPSAANGGT